MNQNDLLSYNIAKALAYRNDMMLGNNSYNSQPCLENGNGNGNQCLYPIIYPCPPRPPCPPHPPHPPCPPEPCPPRPEPGPPGPTGPVGPVGPTTAIVFDGGNASSSYVLSPTFDCGSSK